MKTPLELELLASLKKTNYLFKQKLYSQAAQGYRQCLEDYHLNLQYNNTISSDYLPLTHSLLAQTYSRLNSFQEAEKHFGISLRFDAFSSSTHIRRAKFYLHQKRYDQALEDIALAALYQPDSISLESLLTSLKDQLKNIENQDERERISKRIYQIQTGSQGQEQNEDQCEILNFSKLKKIDRISIKVDPHLLNKRTSQVFFKEDNIVEYETNNQVEKQQNLNPLQIQQKLQSQQKQLQELEKEQEQEPQLIVKISKVRSRKSVLKKQSIASKEDVGMLYTDSILQQPSDELSKSKRSNSSFNSLSVKSIDGKYITKGSSDEKIRFTSQTQQQKIDDNKSQKTNKSRKSCLRNSRIVNQTKPQQSPYRNSGFYFQQIKSIDGHYIKRQQVSPKANDCPSSSDDENNQHDIFGQTKDIQIFNHLKRIESLPMAKCSSTIQKKKSIIRKSSIANNPGASLMHGSWKTQTKKSVCFRTT